MDLKETDIFGDHIWKHWYYNSKAKFMMQMLSGLDFQKIVDIGAGSCFFSKYLLRYTTATQSTCIDFYYEKEESETFEGKMLSRKKNFDTSDATADLVMLGDVLEHIEDDYSFLQDYVVKFKPGTSFFISVPAFQWLWSDHDVFLGHKRRYTTATLTKLLHDSGLKIQKHTYIFGTILPMVICVRVLGQLFHRNKPSQPRKSDLKQYAPWFNTLLVRLCQMEMTVLQHVRNPLGGLTLTCLARKG